MLGSLTRSLGLTVFFFVLLGLVYPLVETGIGQAAFSHQANGSLTAHGSPLVGQQWKGPKWFQGRPDSDDPMATGGSNLGPRSRVLVQDVRKQEALLTKEGVTSTPDLVTTSGSGVDPDISAADAYAQATMVARARGLSVTAVRGLVKSQVQSPQFGFLGSSYIDVLQLNERLATLQ